MNQAFLSRLRPRQFQVSISDQYKNPLPTLVFQLPSYLYYTKQMSYFTTNLKYVIIYPVFGWQTSNVHYYFERLVIMYVEKSRIGQIKGGTAVAF